MEPLQDAREYLQRAYTWADAQLAEAIEAIYRGDAATATRGLDDAAAALSASGLPDDLAEMIAVRVRYLRWQAERIGKAPTEVAQLRLKLLNDLHQLTGSRYAIGTSRSYIIQLRTIDLRDQGKPYPPVEFQADLAQIPAELFTKELRLYLSAWAFLNGDLELVDECYGVFMLEADGFMSAFLWQRVNLMQLLLRGTAQTRDVEELLTLMEHPNQWHDFEMLLLPACIKHGLLDSPDTCQILGQTLHDLHTGSQEMPKRRRRTGRIRRD